MRLHALVNKFSAACNVLVFWPVRGESAADYLIGFCSANVRYCQTIVRVRKDCTPLNNVPDAPWFVGCRQ